MTPQAETILKHLQTQGSITQAEAGLIYKIRALPRRISDLKEAGCKIASVLKADATGQRYARYSLEPEVSVEIKSKTAKVGDRIRVVKPLLQYEDYKVGATGTIRALYNKRLDYFKVDFDHHNTGERLTCVAVFDHEFEVIEHA